MESNSETFKKIGKTTRNLEDQQNSLAPQVASTKTPDTITSPSLFLQNLAEVVKELEQQKPSDYPEIVQYLHELVNLLQKLEDHYRQIAVSWEDYLYLTKQEYAERSKQREKETRMIDELNRFINNPSLWK